MWECSRIIPFARICGCALLLFVCARTPGAQTPANPTADALTKMRADLSAKRYGDVIARGNELLESARAIETSERMQLWQLLAAAYYPSDRGAQQPDSAQLPLAALIRLVPDFKLARDITWAGLDSLAERTRSESFAVVTRPLAEYTIGASAPGHITAVASRPTRFTLTSIDDATGRTARHDSSAFVTVAPMQLISHDERGPIFLDGPHQLHIWAFDSVSGDSLLITHKVQAVRNDLPAPIAPVHAALSVQQTLRPVVATRRTAKLWTGLALAAATAVIAQEARPNDILRSSFRVDPRAFVVGAVMAGATVANFFTRKPVAANAAPQARIVTDPPTDSYRVRLMIDPPGR